jgi:hypothetical protein
VEEINARHGSVPNDLPAIIQRRAQDQLRDIDSVPLTSLREQ